MGKVKCVIYPAPDFHHPLHSHHAHPLLVDTVSGRYTFLNDGGDSIHWETRTAVGDTWRMAWLTDSTWLQARHDSTQQDTVFGQVDSVRYYHLQAVDSGGQLFYHPWNDSVLRLSRQHGLLTMVATDTFPYGPPRIFELQGWGGEALAGSQRWEDFDTRDSLFEM